MSTAEQTKEQAEQKPEEKPVKRAVFKGPFDTFNKALIAAQLNAKAVEKNSENTWHKYKYASAEALIEEARAALNAAGLATIMERWEILPPRQGSEYQIIKIYFKTLHDSSDDTLAGDVEYHIFPEKGRPDDKATATALTYAEGYYLRGLLCLPRVDAETDVDQRNDKGFDPNRRRDQERPQQRGSQQRPNGNGQQSRPQNRQQSRPPHQQRPPQGQQRNGNAAPQQNGTQQQRPANGTAPAQQPQTQPPANGDKQQSADAKPNGASPRSERYQWWRGRICTPQLPAAQLRGMKAAIGKDQSLTDEKERAELADLAERTAVQIEQAAERAGAPPQ